MDHERVDDEIRLGHRGSPAQEGRSQPAEQAYLPQTVGNAAFGQLVGGSAPAAQRAADASQGAGPLDPEIGQEIGRARGGGSPLPEPVQADMQTNLGADLSSVRVHTDAKADALSRSVQAEAFTTGTDVFFRSGAYTPESTSGRRLLAHELTHVVQQSSGQVEGGMVSHPDDAHEVEARAVGDAVASAPVAAQPLANAPAVSREAADGEDDEAVQPAVARQELPEEEKEEEEPPA